MFKPSKPSKLYQIPTRINAQVLNLNCPTHKSQGMPNYHIFKKPLLIPKYLYCNILNNEECGLTSEELTASSHAKGEGIPPSHRYIYYWCTAQKT